MDLKFKLLCFASTARKSTFCYPCHFIVNPFSRDTKSINLTYNFNIRLEGNRSTLTELLTSERKIQEWKWRRNFVCLVDSQVEQTLSEDKTCFLPRSQQPEINSLFFFSSTISQGIPYKSPHPAAIQINSNCSWKCFSFLPLFSSFPRKLLAQKNLSSARYIPLQLFPFSPSCIVHAFVFFI